MPWKARRMMLSVLIVSDRGVSSLWITKGKAYSCVMVLAAPQATEKRVNIVSAKRNMVLDPKMLANLA